jgi:hypothetical protein
MKLQKSKLHVTLLYVCNTVLHRLRFKDLMASLLHFVLNIGTKQSEFLWSNSRHLNPHTLWFSYFVKEMRV